MNADSSRVSTSQAGDYAGSGLVISHFRSPKFERVAIVN